MKLHLNNVHIFLFLVSWLFNHSAIIIWYNNDIKFTLPKMEILNSNKAESFS